MGKSATLWPPLSLLYLAANKKRKAELPKNIKHFKNIPQIAKSVKKYSLQALQNENIFYSILVRFFHSDFLLQQLKSWLLRPELSLLAWAEERFRKVHKHVNFAEDLSPLEERHGCLFPMGKALVATYDGFLGKCMNSERFLELSFPLCHGQHGVLALFLS